MTTRERYLETVLFGKPDHAYFHHAYGLVPGVIDRWQKEGLPEEVREGDIRNYFGFDPKGFSIPVNTSYPPSEPRILEETEECVTQDEGYGKITKMYKKVSSVPRTVRFPLEKPGDWSRIKEAFKHRKFRLTQKWFEEVNRKKEEGLQICFSSAGFYWMPRDLMGDERLCLWYYEYPKIMRAFIYHIIKS